MKQVNRRLFLQGVGGAVVAAPFLGSVVNRTAHAQSAGVPKRLIVLFSHYGCLTNRWFPTKSHGELTAADYSSTTLKHLAPYASKILMPRGIMAMNEWSFGQTDGQETDPHSQVMSSYFTCCPVDGWSGLGSRPSSILSDVPTRKFDARPVGGRSLDHIMAEQVNENGGTPLVLGIGGAQSGEMSNFSYSEAVQSRQERATQFPAVGNPSAVYSELTRAFESGGGGVQAPVATYEIVRGKGILDIARDDLMRLQAVNMSQSDKNKLAAWEALLTETTNAVRSDQCNAAGATALGLDDAAVRSGATNNLQSATPVMMNLAVLSALCDTNRVIFMKFPGTAQFSFLDGVRGDSHGISHRIGNANMGGSCVDGVNEMIAKIDDWYAQQFAYLVGKLDSVDEGDTKLLDNTATIWFQEMSDGNAHNLNNIPIIQAGSCGGYFKTGQAVNVEDGSATLSVGNSEGACQQSGDSIGFNEVQTKTRTPSNVARAPINKYFCNLMNALGVKAGADGFAAKGGTAPVTHFGYYDNTKDFATFLTANPAPSKINEPGEFEDLKA